MPPTFIPALSANCSLLIPFASRSSRNRPANQSAFMGQSLPEKITANAVDNIQHLL
jgi:hypothetical protein